MAKWKSLLDWCTREFEIATRYFSRVSEEYYFAFNMMKTIQDARNKETAEKAIDILKSWIDLTPTTPLTGFDDEWYLMEVSSDTKIYNNKRYSPLFKIMKKKGFEWDTTYTDRNRVEFDGDDDFITFIRGKIDELIPITFPYKPEKIEVKDVKIVQGENRRFYIAFCKFIRNGKDVIKLNRYYCYDSYLGGKNWEISQDKFLEAMQSLHRYSPF